MILKWKSLFGLRPGQQHTIPLEIPSRIAPDGYYLPYNAAELLNSAKRRQWLTMLWDYSSLSKELYQQYYMIPLERCITLMQQFPLTETGHYAYPGGMVDYMLATVAYAARLSQSYLLPVGAPPEDQASQSAAWSAVIIYAAMFQSLEELCHLDVELESGKCWTPFLGMPKEPYRFRFEQEPSLVRVQSFSAMLTYQILLGEAIIWLSEWPEVIKTLSTYLTGFRVQSEVVNAIVSEAIKVSTGQPAPVAVANSVTTKSLQSGSDLVQPIAGVSAVLNPSIATTSPPIMADGNKQSAIPGNNPIGSGDLILASALDSPEVTVPVKPVNVTHTPISTSIDDTDIGQSFWRWLKDGILSGTLKVNTPEARVHFVTGFVFIRAPGIFHQYLTASNNPAIDKAVLQKAFERLSKHRQDKGTMYTCHLYDSKGSRHFKKISGYLIPAKTLYKGSYIPDDNLLLIVK